MAIRKQIGLGLAALAMACGASGQSSPNSYDQGTSEYLADRECGLAGWRLIFRVKGPAWSWPTLLLNATRRPTPARGAIIVLDRKRAYGDKGGFEATGFVARIESWNGKDEMRVRRYIEGAFGGLLEVAGWTEQAWTLRLVAGRPGYAKFDWMTAEYRILGYFSEKRP
jgi:hypothetical protein